MDTIPIKSLPEGETFFCSIFALSIKGDCSDVWKFVARHYANGSSQIQGIGFDRSYSPVTHTESFRINMANVAMHRLPARMLDVNNAFQNTNVSINEIVCISPLTYCLDWFEKYYPNVIINQDEDKFCLQ